MTIQVKKIKDADGDTDYISKAKISGQLIEVSIDSMGEIGFTINGNCEREARTIADRYKMLKFAYKALLLLLKEWEDDGNSLKYLYAIPQEEQGGIADESRRPKWLEKLGLRKNGKTVSLYISSQKVNRKIEVYSFY